ncbi:hypothetical protein [Streptomyces sioyaensis]|uniref:hypothetical protein n=1 Tax=Streptomyces sioyaensis TaxID=67364 RepID=UPI0036E53699
MERLTLLALGTAVCASDLSAVLADHKNITTKQPVDELMAARRDKGAEATALSDGVHRRPQPPRTGTAGQRSASS